VHTQRLLVLSFVVSSLGLLEYQRLITVYRIPWLKMTHGAPLAAAPPQR
jgi:hypothetical protein